MTTWPWQRVRWACRRGMLELDCFLLSFFDDCYRGMGAAAQFNFQRLLTATDPDLYRWLIGAERVGEPSLQRLIHTIQQHSALKAKKASQEMMVEDSLKT